MQKNNSVKIGDTFTIEGEPLTYTVTNVAAGLSKLTADEKEEMERYWKWLYDAIDIGAFIHSWGEDNA